MKRTIKKYHLKSNIKFALITIVLLLIICSILILIEQYNYNKAVIKCGKHNIVTKYTQTGDKYYQCINER